MNTNFEQPIDELIEKIEALRGADCDPSINISEEISRLEDKCNSLTKSIFSKLTDWEKIQLSRHAKRPHTSNYIKLIFEEFDELSGDRMMSDDKAVITGIAKLGSHNVAVIGHEKGRTTKEKIECNFGMAHPEGYRKAARIMRLAEKFNLPLLTFIDTPGAYPGIKAEEHNQSGAIAENLLLMSGLKVPIISTVIGEGGSGGALGIGVCDKLLILEYAYYSTISPEGCATILFKDASKANKVAEILNITSDKLKKLSLVDDVIKEPLGGAHREHLETANNIKNKLITELEYLMTLSKDELLKLRHAKIAKF